MNLPAATRPTGCIFVHHDTGRAAGNVSKPYNIPLDWLGQSSRPLCIGWVFDWLWVGSSAVRMPHPVNPLHDTGDPAIPWEDRTA